MNTGFEGWTHPSVKYIAEIGNPTEIIVEKARTLIFEALQNGWSGPPYDPFELAELLNIETTPNNDVLDARITPKGASRYLIEYNPNQSEGRIRYSIAHEIAHTLFPDCQENVRMRKKNNHIEKDNWQLEMLCNIAAAEFLMPIGSFSDLKNEPLNIDTLMDWRKRYHVSAEALLLRVVKLTERPCFVFCCSRHKEKPLYCFDYTVPSKAFHGNLKSVTHLPSGSCVTECTAIGFTAKNREIWSGDIGEIEIECVGLPAYPNHIFPRVAGIGNSNANGLETVSGIKYVKGNATKPRGDESKILAFIINDKANSWGAGFARQMQKKWPLLLEEFQYWKKTQLQSFRLGNVYTTRLESNLTAALMVAQHGYGTSVGPRVRYQALESALKQVAEEAGKKNASVHMPRIGVGQAGGTWTVIEELIEKEICHKGINVTVYDLPSTQRKRFEDSEELLFK